MGAMRDWADHRDHLVHHVVRQVAMKHPVTHVFGIELDVPGLSDTDQDSVLSGETVDGSAARLGSGHDKLVAMQMDRMVVHADVDEPDPHALALLDDHRSAVR